MLSTTSMVMIMTAEQSGPENDEILDTDHGHLNHKPLLLLHLPIPTNTRREKWNFKELQLVREGNAETLTSCSWSVSDEHVWKSSAFAACRVSEHVSFASRRRTWSLIVTFFRGCLTSTSIAKGRHVPTHYPPCLNQKVVLGICRESKSF